MRFFSLSRVFFFPRNEKNEKFLLFIHLSLSLFQKENTFLLLFCAKLCDKEEEQILRSLLVLYVIRYCQVLRIALQIRHCISIFIERFVSHTQHTLLLCASCCCCFFVLWVSFFYRALFCTPVFFWRLLIPFIFHRVFHSAR